MHSLMSLDFVPLPEVNAASDIIQSEIQLPPWFEPGKIGENLRGLEIVCNRGRFRRLLLRTVSGGSELKVFVGEEDPKEIPLEIEESHFVPGLPGWRIRRLKSAHLKDRETVFAAVHLGMDNINRRLLKLEVLRSAPVFAAALDRELKNILTFCAPQLYPFFRGILFTMTVNRLQIFKALS